METKYNPVIANNAKYSETNYRTSVTDYDTWPWNDEFILERSIAHMGASNQSKTKNNTVSNSYMYYQLYSEKQSIKKKPRCR